MDLIRDAPLGQVIRYLTGNKLLQYPEEKSGFECPSCYAHPGTEKAASRQSTTAPSLSFIDGSLEKELEEDLTEPNNNLHLTRTETDRSRHELSKTNTARSALSRVGSRIALEQSKTRADLEQAFAIASESNPSTPERVQPVRTADGTVLVDWYTTNDPANPQNWTKTKKGMVTALICIYTTAVYTGSAIYTPSAEGVMHVFGVSATAASLGIALFVFAYGLGPLIFSPLSEIASIGRNPPYIITFAIFTILCVPTALADNFAGLMVLRFLQGFFGSPILATGGASLQDMFSLIKLPYILCCWAAAACIGPALGPIISGFSVAAMNWRWSLWEMLWLAAPVWLMLFAFLPETYPENILLRRARRLRKLTGNQNLKAQSEINQASRSFGDVVFEALIRPVQLIVLDPAIAYADLYIALCYAIFYSFFEVFPLVYMERYGFNAGETGLIFLSIAVGVVIAIAAYYAYLYYVVEPEIRQNGLGAPERRLIPALFSSFLVPIGLFIFAWTGDGHIHWIVSCVGIVLNMIGVFILFQCVFVYLAFSYPMFAGSLFAGNDTARSTLAAAAILFSRPMFLNLGIGPGVSLLAGLTTLCIGGIFILFFYGDKLRARSRFTAK
ncbi:MFS general substrate transporter [Aureobasidium pullulans]|uniref:Cercosporin MFS transporter CTB4 n=1 Tax=Aureobasidium pullulans TaxID=5580 RepID=A0A4S8X833_AURPU|nr:MFS general substrate transporter [Aureobasidium pullulans]